METSKFIVSWADEWAAWKPPLHLVSVVGAVLQGLG